LPVQTPDPAIQAALFGVGQRTPKVIPIPTLTPLRPHGSPAPLRRPSSGHPVSRSAGRHSLDTQQNLDFQEDRGNYAGTPASEMIYCDAPVALPVHRAMAAIVDASLILVAVGVFLAIFFMSGGDLLLTRKTIPFVLGIAAVITLFYRFLWCLANGDTPGMRVVGLRLVDFDGRTPDREQRGLRQVASILSVLSAGLGLVWAMVDEEHLTWHDHISKTFPTAG
jgi:uncharacterized RDD family membrane protein YckC